MIFFTSDEHFHHSRVIEYSNRPFSSLEEMHEILIQNNNKKVKRSDTVYHVGDFTFCKNLEKIHKEVISKLNGHHTFIMGSHDYWHKTVCRELSQRIVFHDVQHIKYQKEYIVACHYPMLTWPRSHYNSWHVYGHHHGKRQNDGKSWDVGVDNNNYFPVSFNELVSIMESRPDNINFINIDNRRK